MTLARLAILSLTALALAACAPNGSASDALAGTQWWLEAMPNAPTPVAAQVPTAVFEADRASGRAGCNTWMATYQYSGTTLTFGPIGVTRKMCPYGMPYEQAFLAALKRTARATVEGERLTLTDAGGADLLRFHRASPIPPPQQ